MFKKLITVTIAASVLLSLPLAAEHHHHTAGDTVKITVEQAKEHVKAKEKSTADKAIGGTMQVVNKLAWLESAAAGSLAALIASKKDCQDSTVIIAGIGTVVISYALIKAITDAIMSQEDVKPLKK